MRLPKCTKKGFIGETSSYLFASRVLATFDNKKCIPVVLVHYSMYKRTSPDSNNNCSVRSSKREISSALHVRTESVFSCFCSGPPGLNLLCKLIAFSQEERATKEGGKGQGQELKRFSCVSEKLEA